MKKLVFGIFLLFFSHFCFSQTTEPSPYPNSEVNLNIANTIAIASVEVGYEYFIGFNQSVGIKVLINDRMNYHLENGSDKFNTNSVKLNYNFYFGAYNPGSGVYVQPFVKYRFGNFKEKKTVKDDFGDSSEIAQKTNMDTFMIGIGIGYEWNFSNSFVIGPFANIARNFSEEVQDRFSAIDFNAGLNVGYRF